MTDLQALYGIRHQLIRRETIRKHNDTINKKWEEAADKKVPNEKSRRIEAWNR